MIAACDLRSADVRTAPNGTAVIVTVRLSFPVDATWTFARPAAERQWRPAAVQVAGDQAHTIGLTRRTGVVSPVLAAELDRVARDAGHGLDAPIVAFPGATHDGPAAA